MFPVCDQSACQLHLLAKVLITTLPQSAQFRQSKGSATTLVSPFASLEQPVEATQASLFVVNAVSHESALLE